MSVAAVSTAATAAAAMATTATTLATPRSLLRRIDNRFKRLNHDHAIAAHNEHFRNGDFAVRASVFERVLQNNVHELVVAAQRAYQLAIAA